MVVTLPPALLRCVSVLQQHTGDGSWDRPALATVHRVTRFWRQKKGGLVRHGLHAGSWGATWARTNSQGGGWGSNPASVKSVQLRAQWDGDGANTEHSWEPLLCSSAAVPCPAFPLRGPRTPIVTEKVSNTRNYFPRTEFLITANDAEKILLSSETKKVTKG